ncbi:uncharacterized protein LOC132301471 isoform X3 [Cornus florida]|uniref:uncharacterized protein LOC132301471 isoform X3 n=1 Tax=Cornus florida TaxID=4283 RepID=UPI00289C10A7|nr:uncharacterized protein LOC132301471 isoform X3 [Cornus florida]
MVMLMKGQVSPNFGTTLVVRRNFILTGKQYSSRWKYNLNDNHCSNFAAYYPGKQGGGETQTRAHLLKRLRSLGSRMKVNILRHGRR